MTDQNNIEVQDAPQEETLGLSVDEARERALQFAMDQAIDILEQGGVLTPFSVMVVGEDLYVENHPGEDVAECFRSARTTVYAMQKKIDSYVFCYDGYVDLDEGTRDAIICETALVADEAAHAYALMYTIDESGDGTLTFDEGLADLGAAPVLFLDAPLEYEEFGIEE